MQLAFENDVLDFKLTLTASDQIQIADTLAPNDSKELASFFTHYFKSLYSELSNKTAGSAKKGISHGAFNDVYEHDLSFSCSILSCQEFLATDSFQFFLRAERRDI